jgi:hypothetical protein
MLKTPFINGLNGGADNPFLYDKLALYYMLRTIGAPTPEVFGLATSRGIAWMTSDAESMGLIGLLERERELVLKPTRGRGGTGVKFVSLEAGDIYVNGSRQVQADLRSHVVPGTLICARVQQGEYARRIAPMASNTIRIIAMWDYEKDEPFIAAAEHKFGTTKSAPVDNQGKGGLVAGVDLKTGVMGRAMGSPKLGVPTWHSHHPETGESIEGQAIPTWAQIDEGLQAVMRRMRHIPYVGWDVLAGHDQFFLIEGNSHPDLNTQAVTGPLLSDPRVRRFFEHHGVVRGSGRRDLMQLRELAGSPSRLGGRPGSPLKG